MLKLSVCITVYNQYEIVKRNLDNLLQYHGNDVEFIVSDDCSIDDIQALVDSYKDERLKYYCVSKNGGHDLNIIHAIEKASADYVLILRSRDTVFSDKIIAIVDSLLTHPNISYAVFSAVDEEGKLKVFLQDKIYKQGEEALVAHTKLFTHPSGNIYKKNLLDTQTLRNCINNSFNHKFGFSVHTLIRMQLACKGDFLTSSEIVWSYPNSEKQSDKAVNSIEEKSVYDPTLNYERMKCELTFVNDYLIAGDKEKLFLNRHIVITYYKRITYDFKRINNNKEMQQHYGYKAIDFSPAMERAKFEKYINNYFLNISYNDISQIMSDISNSRRKLIYYYPVRDAIMHKFLNKEKIIKLSAKLKGI